MSKKIEDLLTDQSFRRFVLNPHQGDYAAWEDWLNCNEENKRLYLEARQLIMDFYNPLSQEEFESQSIEFIRRINVTKSEQKDIVSLYEQRNPKHRRIWVKYAAAILFLMVSAFMIMLYSQNFFRLTKELSLTSQIIEKATTTGQKMTIVFPDGTLVKLNSESTISYPEEFSKECREVTLIGEAYFDVAHYDDWPFVVKSEGAETMVRGTEFNVTAYPEAENSIIALVSGSVHVRTQGKQSVMLEPMQMATVKKRQQDLMVSDFDLLQVTGWKDNVIVFKKATFSEIQSTLERWYGVKFIYDNIPRFEGGYTGNFADESLESILIGIGSNKFDFEITGKKVYIN
jgi:ferric-dicitrate binding protein FerR (iron transport regulator)